MKDKTKIIMIYSGVAVLSFGLLVFFNFLGKQRRALALASDLEKRASSELIIDQKVSPLTLYDKQIKVNLNGVNQENKQVSLFDLKGKVVVFAQFYSRCSECLGYNRTIMQELYEHLKGNPNIHFVTVTLDPEFDTPEKLKQCAKTWNAESASWWMMNVPKNRLVKFCREQLWYIDYKENAKKTSASDAITHDMGIAVIDTESKLQAKVNLFELLANDRKDLYQAKKSQLLEVIEISVAAANNN